jgi:predicted phage replisome organizer
MDTETVQIEQLMEPKKYYWLKLKKDFFKRHDIRIIEGMPNGKDYVLFYLKLLVESLDHDGKLRFSDTIPYSESMLATITNTNVDIVRSAIKIFAELQMMQLLDDGTLFLLQVEMLTGSETEYAEKKRIYRRGKDLQIEDKSKTKKDNVRQEIRDKRIEKDIHTAAPEAVPICQILINEHRKIDPSFLAGKEHDRIAQWSVDVDKINRIDGRDWQTIEKVMRWCKNDGFWAKNIMSGKKFREQFDRLYAGMMSSKPKTETTSIESLPDLPPELAQELTNGRI